MPRVNRFATCPLQKSEVLLVLKGAQTIVGHASIHLHIIIYGITPTGSGRYLVENPTLHGFQNVADVDTPRDVQDAGKNSGAQ